jgi:hypothetical protein
MITIAEKAIDNRVNIGGKVHVAIPAPMKGYRKMYATAFMRMVM